MNDVHFNPERNFLLRMIGFNKRIETAKGTQLYDEDGRAYLDLSSQYDSVPFGYNPEFLWETLNQVREKGEPSYIQPFNAIAAAKLAERLATKNGFHGKTLGAVSATGREQYREPRHTAMLA